MTSLQKELSKAKAKEDEVVENFQHIASWIQELSESGDGGNKPIKETLTKIRNAVGEAIEKIREKERENEEEEAKDLEEEAAKEEVDKLLNLERQIQESSAWSHLKLVVDSFETQLKRCLFTLTVFPPKAVIKKRLLFHWWMGEGILKPGHSGVQEGKKCFEQLISRGFIIPVKDKHCEKNHYCTIQTWIRRLLISVAKSNAFLEYEETTFPNVDYTRSHRACLRAKKTFVSDDEKADGELLTVYNVSKRYIDFTAEWLVNKTDLTTLQLGRWKDKVADDKKHHIEVKSSDLLEGLGNCRKLRYVSLRGVSRLEKLPEDFGKFKDLVVLDLRACHNLEKLPVSVGSAKRLEYLDISECYLLDQIPNKVAELKQLRVFKGFVVGDPLNPKLCQVSDLVKLPNLRKLSINTGREFRPGELEKLHELKTLTSLTITWGLVKKEEPSPGETAAPPKHDANQNLSDAGGTAPATLDKKSTTARVNPTTVVDENRDQPSHASTGLAVTPKKAQENKKVSLIPPKTSRESNNKSANPKKQPTTTTPTPTDVLPPEITKLDLRCFNEAQFPNWISPDKLKKLKKFYLRGGMLESLGKGTGWTVEVLRLRYLEHLDHDWDELKSKFPNLKYVEKVSCKGLESWPWPEKVDSWPWPQKEDSPCPDNKNRWGERTV
ncbi:disease resistance protein RGA1 [Canna indica]|uniref:Disease resistance protein RGA1 n=1 Tax=Canna indica TaxID=4628 RepID=A0AAQ3JMZ0_9LILI|nr:disease resistance protein RGA1 [Canna indica]